MSPDENANDQSNIRRDNLVQTIKFGHPNIFLIKTESGYILVDTGMPNMGEKLDAAFADRGLDPNSVQLIIATHGHLDHVGSIAYAQRVTGGKVLCHRSFSDDLMNGKIERAVPQNITGRLLNLLTGFMGSKIEGTNPDILVDDEFDLGDFGVAGKVIHTPGHSPSSVSIILDNGEALVGDLVREVSPGVIGIGMFFVDKVLVLDSLEKVLAIEPTTIYLSHGTSTDSGSLRNFLETNK
jgi:glyoxylase-like metal-dependent hydrolase (beta-lactamase superfamily II)